MNINEAISVERDRCLQAVDDETEFPGDMPDEMWDAISGDRDAMAEALRIAVRMTKDGIRERIMMPNAELCGGEAVRTSAGLVAWLPIETAPQDNKARLVYCPDNECMFCVSFDKMDGSWIYFGGGGTLVHVPTHWMPLPEAPNA